MGRRPHFLLCLTAASWYTPQWFGSPQSPLPLQPRGNPTLCLHRISPSSPWSVAPSGGGTPPGPWSSPWSPLSYHWCTRAPTAPPPYTFLSGPAPFLLSFTTPSLPFLAASEISAGFGRPLPNRCYCRQFSALVMGNPLTVVLSPYLSETRPCLPQSSVVSSRIWDAFPLLNCISPMRSGGCLVSLLGLGFRSAQTWGGGWGITPGSWSGPPSTGC